MTLRRTWWTFVAALAALTVHPATARERDGWTAAWATAQMVPAGDQVVPAEWLEGATVRQVVRVGLTGKEVRLRLTNAFGTAPLAIGAVTLARPLANSAARIDPGSLQTVTFGGEPSTVIPAGAELWSDPVPIPVAAGDDLAISLYLPGAPAQVTGHPGSRATTHFLAGDHVLRADMPGAQTAPRWLFLGGVEVLAPEARAIAVLGDSITDGFGVQPDRNERWTDFLSARLRADPRFAQVSVLNAGIGGNRLLHDGLGPNALARLDRDVLSHPGVTHLIVLEGVNDLGTLTRDAPVSAEAHAAFVNRAIGALQQIVLRARSRGVTVIGATIMPFGKSGYYHPPAETEADRQAINEWIRTPGHFDGVIDLDAATSDPADPSLLAVTVDSGDGLHPSIEGYRAMAEAVTLDFLR